MPDADYQPLGVAFHLQQPPAELMDAVDAGLGRYPSDLGVHGSLQVRTMVHADQPGDPAWPKVTAADGPDELVVRCGSATATLRYATGHVLLDLPSSLLPVVDALRLFVESVFTASAVRAGQLYAVHSALVAHRGVGLLLRGPSGAGKSTLTYSCLRRGLQVCSDDWVYAPAAVPPRRFAGYPWRMMMTEDAASRFPELVGQATVPHPAAEGRKVPVVPPVELQLATAAVDVVVLLDPDPELSLAPISVDEALERFWASSLPTEREHLADEWVRALMDRPVYLLRRGTDPASAAQALIRLAESLR
jgi:hypothetical protein